MILDLLILGFGVNAFFTRGEVRSRATGSRERRRSVGVIEMEAVNDLVLPGAAYPRSFDLCVRPPIP